MNYVLVQNKNPIRHSGSKYLRLFWTFHLCVNRNQIPYQKIATRAIHNVIYAIRQSFFSQRKQLKMVLRFTIRTGNFQVTDREFIKQHPKKFESF